MVAKRLPRTDVKGQNSYQGLTQTNERHAARATADSDRHRAFLLPHPSVAAFPGAKAGTLISTLPRRQLNECLLVLPEHIPSHFALPID
ncbi:MAG: hypothetical protein JWP38_1 [Herbaspirillum sp.]|nr:hypothetical protein [Herbaspirillum sp.]